jgi:hypothetical protein
MYALIFSILFSIILNIVRGKPLIVGAGITQVDILIGLRSREPRNLGFSAGARRFLFCEGSLPSQGVHAVGFISRRSRDHSVIPDHLPLFRFLGLRRLAL